MKLVYVVFLNSLFMSATPVSGLRVRGSLVSFEPDGSGVYSGLGFLRELRFFRVWGS